MKTRERAKLKSSKDAVARIEAVYARLPAIECRGRCQESCGLIGMSEAEHLRIATVRRQPVEYDFACGECNALTKAGRCAIYAVRPMICRLWGLTPEMRCPHGCKPERLVLKNEAYEMMDELADIIGGIERINGMPMKGTRVNG